MSKGKVSITGANATGTQSGGWGPAGQYLNETVVPAIAFVAAGYAAVLATPNGTKAAIAAGPIAALDRTRRERNVGVPFRGD